VDQFFFLPHIFYIVPLWRGNAQFKTKRSQTSILCWQVILRKLKKRFDLVREDDLRSSWEVFWAYGYTPIIYQESPYNLAY